MPFQTKIEFDSEDWAQIEEMCLIQCTAQEIANIMRVSYSTLERRIKEEYNVTVEDYIKALSAPGRKSLRRWQYEAAEKGNIQMMIWLGKQWLDQKESREDSKNIQEIRITGGFPSFDVTQESTRSDND